MRRSILLLLPALLSLWSPAWAQTEKGSYLSSRRIEKTVVLRGAIATGDNSSTLYLAHGLADKILSLRNVQARSLGAARIADVLWTQDEQYARVLFEKALSVTSSLENKDADPRLLSSLRRSVTTIIARRDSDWAKRLIDDAAQTGDSEQDSKMRSAMNLNAAQSLLEGDPELAVKFAERSLQGNFTPAFLEFLLSLRKTKSASAHALFLRALAHMGQQPTANIRAFHTLGVYLFAAPNLLDSDTFAVTRVGDLMVPNIASQRPEIPNSLVREYLRIAGIVLWRAASDPEQKPSSYALAYLLLPKAKSVAPDLAHPIESSMAAIVSGVSPSLADETAYKYINALPANAADRLDSAEKKPDQESREMAYLDIANWAYRKGDFKTARLANGRIANQELAAKVGVLIDFGEAAWSMKLDRGQGSKVSATAHRLPQGIEKAILYLAIAKANSAEPVQAEEAVDSALKASRSVEDARRPFLMLMAAAELADLKSPAAQFVLPQAIKELNSFDETAYASLDWNQTVQVGQLEARFPLAAGNVNFSFSKAFHRAVSADLEWGVACAEELKGENLRAQGFVEVAAALVERLSKTTPQDEPIVRVGEDGMRKSAAKTVMPAYPEEAVKKRLQGTVVVELQYDSKGNVTSVSVLEAPAGSIGAVVAQAVKKWKFVPSKTIDGKPVSIRGKLTFYFEIDKGGKGLVNNPKQYR